MADKDVLNIETQAKFMSTFGADFAKNIKKSKMDYDRNALNPVNAIDSLTATLRDTGASSEYIEAVEELKTDPDIIKAIEHFEKALKGEANMHELRKAVYPDNPGADSRLGLYEKIVKEEVEEEEDSELVQYTNYITEYGGHALDVPTSVMDMFSASLDTNLIDFVHWEEKMNDAQQDLDKIKQEEIDFEKKYGDNPRRIIDKAKTADLQDGATRKALADVEAKSILGKKKTAVATHELYTKKLADVANKKAGRIKASETLGKVSSKIGVATAGFGTVTGALGVATGHEMMQDAKKQLQNGEIDQAEYEDLRREAQMSLASGAFGIGSGINDIGNLISEKVGPKIAKKFAQKGIDIPKKMTKMLSRFGTIAGSALSIGMSALSLASNAMAADEARQEKNYGKMAMYGVMAALDGVSIILDVVSTVLDFIPGIGQAISIIVDLVNTIVGFISMIIGYFADLVDTRTDQDKVKQAFDEYVDSKAFKDYVDRQAKVYKDQGYDLFQYIIDAKALEIKEGTFDSSKVDKTIIKKLTENAIKDSSNKQLRIALIDASSIGRELRGRAGDDLIMAGAGADTIYGEDGDDLLYGEQGKNTLYGGPGNDYLNGGTGRNELFGGEGDDWMVVKPGLDTVVDGGPGSDTVEVSADFFNWYKYGAQNTIKLGMSDNHVQGCYVDLSNQNANGNGRAGLALGALLSDISDLDRPDPIHKKAFTSRSSLETNLKSLFWADAYRLDLKNLSGKMVWFLAQDNTSAWNTDLKYVTDGQYLYAHGKKEGWTGTWKSHFTISSIPTSIANYDETTMALTYNPGKELEALFLFAFRGTKCVRSVEKIIESPKELDINLTVVGDNNTNNLIDIMYGYNEYVYTGNGDNVVIMSSSRTPQFEMYKYIIGGDGNNMLIINSSTRGRVVRGHLFMLLNADTNLAEANKTYNFVNSEAWSGNKVDRGIYLKNIKRIQFNAEYKHNANFYVDASNLSGGNTFIVNSDTESFRLVGTPGDDTIYIKNIARKSSHIDGFSGTNLLSFESYEGGDILTVKLSEGISDGSIKGYSIWTTIKNIEHVKGSNKVQSIEGNNRDNLLIASGGSTTVTGKGGRNTLVSMRGCHNFIGGNNGINTYIINGPDIFDILTITVTNVHKAGLKASCLNGVWQNNMLTLDLLKNESSAIRLVAAMIVDGSGNRISNKGSVSIENNKIYFRILHHFNNLEDGKSETIRMQCVTRGSTATIDEPGDGCCLRLSNFGDPSDIKIVVNSDDNLEFQTLSDDTILVDQHWGNAYRDGKKNLVSLIADFARRFQIIVFEMSGTVLDYKGVFDMLQGKLSSMLTDGSNDYDHLTDISNVTQSSTMQYTLGDGNNHTLFNVSNLKLALGSGRNLVDVSCSANTSAGYYNTTISLGSGDTTVVLGTGRENVYIKNFSNGSLSLIFKNINPNALTVEDMNGPKYALSYNNTPIAFLEYVTPSKIYFLNNGVVAIIDDIPKYLKTSGTYYHRLELADGKHKLRLRIPTVSSSDVQVSANVTDKGIRMRFSANDETVYEFITNTTEMDVEYLALATRYQLLGGVVMKDETKVGQALEDFVRNQLEVSIGNPGIPEGVIYLSKRDVPQLTLTSADEIVIADKIGAIVNTSGGNDLIRVTASSVTVQTGEGQDTVFIQSSAHNVSVAFKAPDNLYVSGRNVLVLEGITGSDVTLTDQNDGRLSSQPYENTNIPVKIKNGSTLIVQVDKAPSCLMFKNGNEYEVIPFGRVPSYFSDQPRNQYATREVVNANMEMILKATDIRSSDLRVSVTTYSTSGSIRLHTNSVFSIYQVYFRSGGARDFRATDLTLKVASHFPGGIQFQDCTKTEGQFLVFLLRKIADATVSGISITSGTWSESQAKSEFNTYLAENIQSNDYTTIIANVNKSLLA